MLFLKTMISQAPWVCAVRTRAVYPACPLSGQSCLAEIERLNTRYFVYSACLSGRSYLAEIERLNTRYVVYSVCLSGRSYLVESEMSSGWQSELRSGAKVEVAVLGTLLASLSGTFLQTLPDLVTPLKGHSLSPRSCPPMRSAPSERFGC